MAELSISQAAREWGISRRTLQRRASDGTVTVTVVTGNRKTVDTAEMIRVFGEPVSQRDTVTMPDKTHPDVRQVQHRLELAEQEIRHLREILVMKDEQIRQLQTPKLLTWVRELRKK